MRSFERVEIFDATRPVTDDDAVLSAEGSRLKAPIRFVRWCGIRAFPGALLTTACSFFHPGYTGGTVTGAKRGRPYRGNSPLFREGWAREKECRGL